MKTITTLSLVGALAIAGPALAQGPSGAAAVPSAQKQCRTERSGMGTTLFRSTYGTNANDANAFGKCVSARNRATAAAVAQARANAAEQCRSARAADAATFAQRWGGRPNAFGKCVSETARTLAAARVKRQVKADVNAAKSCRAARKADPATFAEQYGTNANAFGKCVSRTAKAGSTA